MWAYRGVSYDYIHPSKAKNQILFPKKKRLDAVYIANFKKRETSITNIKNVKFYVFENIYMLILFLIQENVLQRSAQGKQRLKKFYNAYKTSSGTQMDMKEDPRKKKMTVSESKITFHHGWFII